MRCISQGQLISIVQGKDYTDRKTGVLKSSFNAAILPDGDTDTIRMLVDSSLSPDIAPGRYQFSFELVRLTNKPVWYRLVSVKALS